MLSPFCVMKMQERVKLPKRQRLLNKSLKRTLSANVAAGAA
jgi:hypothetical protein